MALSSPLLSLDATKNSAGKRDRFARELLAVQVFTAQMRVAGPPAFVQMSTANFLADHFVFPVVSPSPGKKAAGLLFCQPAAKLLNQ